MRLVDLEAAVVNRSALVVRPKQRYIDWASSLDGEAGEHSETLKDTCTVYLVPEVTMLDELDGWVREHYDRIFEQELPAWCRDAEEWPQDRGHTTSGEWSGVDTVDVVIDLGREPIKTEVL